MIFHMQLEFLKKKTTVPEVQEILRNSTSYQNLLIIRVTPLCVGAYRDFTFPRFFHVH